MVVVVEKAKTDVACPHPVQEPVGGSCRENLCHLTVVLDAGSFLSVQLWTQNPYHREHGSMLANLMGSVQRDLRTLVDRMLEWSREMNQF